MRICIARCAAVCFLLASLMAAAAEINPAKESAIPFKRTEEATSAGSLWRVVAGFMIAAAIGVGAVYVLKRYVPASVGRIAGKSGRIDVVEIRRVSSQLTLFLIKVDGETILLAQSGNRIRQVRMSRSDAPNENTSNA